MFLLWEMYMPHFFPFFSYSDNMKGDNVNAILTYDRMISFCQCSFTYKEINHVLVMWLDFSNGILGRNEDDWVCT
jgi:hypothetical protein